MLLNNFPFVFMLPLYIEVYCNNLNKKNETRESLTSLLGGLVNLTLEYLRPSLVNFQIIHQNFDTGVQEFGDFKGNVQQVNITGLNDFRITTLETSLLNINNLTLVTDKFNIIGRYNINGTLAFPLGKDDINLFGTGRLSANFTNFSVSTRMKIHYLNGMKVVKDIDIQVHLEKMRVYLENLMGGGDLESAINQLINDVGMTVFNYYKKPVMDDVKLRVATIITEMLNKHSDRVSVKDEL